MQAFYQASVISGLNIKYIQNSIYFLDDKYYNVVMKDNSTQLKDFLELTYKELEDLNINARAITDNDEAKRVHIAYLEGEPKIKAVTLCFSDIEGSLHMLDYNKTYFIDSYDNLTFDGSSIRGFSELEESDLRLSVDWTSLTFLPADIFGAGKVMIFSNITKGNGEQHDSDFRGRLIGLSEKLAKEGLEARMAPEIEGFLIRTEDAEQNYRQTEGFELVSTGGYYHSLPLDSLRQFVDRTAEALRALGYRNEKDHAEVAPSQFEINFSHAEVLRACDQTLLYKLVCRQVAASMGMTATFLPKPKSRLNGSGMHVNVSLSKNGKNIFYDGKDEANLSKAGYDFVAKVLNRAPELCLIINSSVNSYRRLDPNFEAPNQINVSANNRGSMIRIPTGNEKSARIEVRSVAPDCNPYLAMYSIIKIGVYDKLPKEESGDKKTRLRFLPGTINDALRIFKASDYITELLGENPKAKYAKWKNEVANRSPRELGTKVKDNEVLFHHEVTNQYIWNQF